MKLIVGLGNPGRKYQATRHNIGFAVLGAVARRFGDGAVKSKFHGEAVEACLNGHRALLLSPLTYMNRSGISVQEAKSFFKVLDGDLLVICDDLHLPFGKLRLRTQGSSGGQKGLEDIIRRIGSDGFARLRVGIGRPPGGWNWADYVLSKFAKEEEIEVEEAVRQAADAVALWVGEGVEACMNQYN